MARDKHPSSSNRSGAVDPAHSNTDRSSGDGEASRARPPADKAWYVSGPYGVRGPMDEVELRQHLANPETLQVKQGFSTWYPANVIRNKLEKLDREGIYLNRSGTIEGPYTLAKAYAMLRDETDQSIQVKTTVKGAWVPLPQWLETIERMRRG